MFVTGQVSTLFLLVIFSIFIGYKVYEARKKLPYMRRIPALDVIEEAIRRATEMGKSVIWSPGEGGSLSSGTIISSISIMSYIADQCIELDTPLICVCLTPDIYSYVTDMLKIKYQAQGKPENFNPGNIIFAPTGSYKIECVNALQEKNVGTTFWIGSHWGTAIIFSEAGAIAGCFQVGWTSDNSNIPYFVMGCDYALIAEEGYSAGAYLSKEVFSLGSFAGQDICKLFCIAILLIGSILMTFNVNILKNLMGL